MPFNGSGTFTLAEAAFVPGTVINSTVMNSDLSDIATNGLTNAVTKDGQTVITAPIKFASGSVGLPGITFSADTDSGFYRIGANNIGISVGGTKILDIASTGLGVVGAVSPSTTVTNAVGTVSLPSYTFTGDLNSGMYWIGADNIGVGVAGAKVLDISATGLNVVGTLSANGATFSPLAQGAGMVNGTITITQNSPVSNALTIAIKTLAGNDPNAGDPVFFAFRNVTQATGNYTVIQLTAALSLVITSGSTMGFTSTVAGRLWIEIFNDNGTLRLAAINCKIGASIFPLGKIPLSLTTAEGGAGGADTAQIFYTGTAITGTARAYAILGYADWAGLTTAGAWDTAPATIQLFSNGVPLPGDPIQVQPTIKTDTATISVTSGTYADITGVTVSIPVVSSANVVVLDCSVNYCATSTSTSMFILALRGSTALTRGDAASNRTRATIANLAGPFNQGPYSSAFRVWDGTPGSGTVAYKLQITGDRTENYFINRTNTDTDSSAFGRTASYITATEFMA